MLILGRKRNNYFYRALNSGATELKCSLNQIASCLPPINFDQTSPLRVGGWFMDKLTGWFRLLNFWNRNVGSKLSNFVKNIQLFFHRPQYKVLAVTNDTNVIPPPLSYTCTQLELEWSTLQFWANKLRPAINKSRYKHKLSQSSF